MDMKSIWIWVPCVWAQSGLTGSYLPGKYLGRYGAGPRGGATKEGGGEVSAG